MGINKPIDPIDFTRLEFLNYVEEMLVLHQEWTPDLLMWVAGFIVNNKLL